MECVFLHTLKGTTLLQYYEVSHNGRYSCIFYFSSYACTICIKIICDIYNAYKKVLKAVLTTMVVLFIRYEYTKKEHYYGRS